MDPFNNSHQNTKRRRHKQMTNFHEFQSTARRAHAGVSPRWSNIRWQVLCPVVQSPRDTSHHFSPNIKTEESGGEEEEKQKFLCDKLPGVVNTSSRKPQFGPDILNQLHASAGILSLQSNECQVPVKRLTTLVKRSPAMPDTPTKDAAEDGKVPQPRAASPVINLPRLLYTPRGNQATDESEPRCLTSGWTKFGNTIHAILYKGHCDCLKGFSKYREGFVPIDLTPIRNFKYCFTIENK